MSEAENTKSILLRKIEECSEKYDHPNHLRSLAEAYALVTGKLRQQPPQHS